ncbi:hypothetical protein K469DRAFT_725927 [Zopfia rhizophila CBS 207.26]|uniref:Uncharacterized protein n=1 Tax=Zopfia rhizophila CBS 207.26 TaxID=1314779 RepID=A0A6A6EXP6_9PEZI|nr:hypothetical protein K469DRAFT_725927 [Zopfia rhizophila CBS 207.26]
MATISSSSSTFPFKYGWEDGPLQLITNPVSQTGTHLQTSPYIAASDYRSFVVCASSCYEGLEVHDTGEEEHFSPEIEKETGEKGFHDGFQAWGKCKFDAERCIELIDSFTGPLPQHLAEEIPTLLSLSKCGDEIDHLDMIQREGEIVMAGMSKTTQLPDSLMDHDLIFEGGIHTFPPLPSPVKWVLRNVFARVNGDW